MPPARGLCAVVLAAGAGTRLRPLTERLPKALCPVGNVSLLDRAIARVAGLGLGGPDALAVNAHHHADAIVAAVGARAHLSLERPEALGTAGAIAHLRDWVDGRDVLVCNADAYLAGGDPAVLVEGWDGRRPRLLTVEDPARGDFGTRRFAGMSLLPWAEVARLDAVPTGLYEVVWRAAAARDELGFADWPGTFVDCGRPADYLSANLHAALGAPGGSLVAPGAVITATLEHAVVGAGARVDGSLTRAVVWPGGVVTGGEHLVDAIRTADGLTVDASGA